MSPQEERVDAESFLIKNKSYKPKVKFSYLIFKYGLLVKTYKRCMSFIQFPPVELMPMFVKMGVSSTVTFITGKTVTYINFVKYADVC